MASSKTCTRCGEEKDIETMFSVRKNGEKRYPAPICHACDILKSREYRKDGTYKARQCLEKRQESNRKGNEERKRKRREGVDPARFILEDSKRGDQKYGREFDLDREFVEGEISKGCSYCGSHKHMTMDRLDNAIGHVKTNVVPACYRCNMIRRDMPHEAWLMIVPAIRATAESGLFGDWYSVPMARKANTRKSKI